MKLFKVGNINSQRNSADYNEKTERESRPASSRGLGYKTSEVRLGDLLIYSQNNIIGAEIHFATFFVFLQPQVDA